MAEVDRKKTFSSLEKDLFLNITQKYDAILTCKQTNATSAFKKKHSWEKITEEFNESSIVTQKASTKELIELWYNMKAKENVHHLTGGGRYDNMRTIKIDSLKCKILEEELEFKKKLHEEELKMKILEREHKQNLFKIELEIKIKELEKIINNK